MNKEKEKITKKKIKIKEEKSTRRVSRLVKPNNRK